MPCIDELLTNATLQLVSVSDSSSLDADVLLAFVLKKERAYLRAWSEKNLTTDQISAFNQLLQQRLLGSPIAYLTGQREFWSREFNVNASVLIPRAETELLIELSLPLIPQNRSFKVLDLGTGSGIIGITLAAECKNISVMATDLSTTALAMAQKNATRYQLDHITYQQSDWFAQIEATPFDLIISNPPYIDENDPHLQQGDVRFEPRQALISKEKGLQDITIIIETAFTYLNPNGHLLIEHGCKQSQQVQTIFQRHAYKNITTYHDLAGHPRVTLGQKP